MRDTVFTRNGERVSIRRLIELFRLTSKTKICTRMVIGSKIGSTVYFKG